MLQRLPPTHTNESRHHQVASIGGNKPEFVLRRRNDRTRLEANIRARGEPRNRTSRFGGAPLREDRRDDLVRGLVDPKVDTRCGAGPDACVNAEGALLALRTERRSAFFLDENRVEAGGKHQFVRAVGTRRRRSRGTARAFVADSVEVAGSQRRRVREHPADDALVPTRGRGVVGSRHAVAHLRGDGTQDEAGSRASRAGRDRAQRRAARRGRRCTARRVRGGRRLQRRARARASNARKGEC